MKKFLMIVAAAAAFTACEQLADNEYLISGTIEGSDYDGKMVILEKQGGYTGFAPVDTATVENGKFTFRGTTEEPSLHFISVAGIEQGKANFILEEGKIKIDINKDTIYQSVMGGTYNNDKLHEYYESNKAIGKKMMKFQENNITAMMQAQQTQDTVTMNRLNKEYKVLAEESQKNNVAFVKNNPKAFINVFIVRQLLNSDLDKAEVKAMFEGLDEEVKNTKDGKEVAKVFEDMDKAEQAKANVGVGKPAPSFSAPTPKGDNLSLKEAMGKVTVIDFWASWCKPCRGENPNVVAMYNELHSQGLNIIGVSLDRDAESWNKAIEEDKLAWNHVSNLKFWDEPIAKTYGVESIPATFILDENGVIVAKDLRGEALKAKVKELLAQ